MLSAGTLTSELKALGLERGDVVLVHSSYKSLGGVEGGPQTLLDTLLEILGRTGTLILPTFNFDFCKGSPFDVRTTPSHMGVLTELGRGHPQSRRVFHPIYSFAILGALREELGSLRYQSSFGGESLFGKLRELDGKIMVIGLSYTDSMTFFHHVEEMEGCDYRFLKAFEGEVTDAKGSTRRETYLMLVRDLSRGVVTAVDPMGTILEQQGVVKIRRIGEATVKLMNANDVYRITAREMKRDPQLLYQLQPESGSG